MRPNLHAESWLFERRHFLRLLMAAGCGLSAAAGCTGPLVRSQSPTPESYIDEELEARIKLIGDLTATWGFNYLKVESVALVTGLNNTGSDPPPSNQRQTLLEEMQSHQVEHPNQVLSSPATSMVIVRGYLPPGCQKGDIFDVEVRIPPRSETTSLRGGWMMQSRMRETEFMGGAVRTGHILALAQGPVIVDAVFNNNGDPVQETRGRVLSGAVATKPRKMGLVVRSEYHSVRTSTAIASAINMRFHTFDRGIKTGVADPKDDNYIELMVYPRYKNNLTRYVRVVRSLAINEGQADRAQRLILLEQMIRDPVSAPSAALQLEAIGKEGIPILKRALDTSDPEVRFYAAEALAYLDEPECTKPLREAAEQEPAFRWHAIAALASMDDLTAYEQLNGLLHVTSAETRYGAFRALRKRNPNDPLLKGTVFHQEFSLHVVPTSADPLVHFTQSSRPEIVLFGDQIELLPTDFVFAGDKIVVKRIGPQELRISHFSPGKPDEVEVCSTRLDEVIRTAGRMGAHYEDMLTLVHEAKRQNFVTAKVMVDALPRANRMLEKQYDDSAAATASRRRVASPLPDLFNNRLGSETKDDDTNDPATIAALELEQNAERASKKPSFWSKMNPWKKEPE